MDLILDNILGFLYIWQEFHSFLSYIDCMGIIPKMNDICLVDICHKHYSYGSKIFLVLMIRRGNNFGHRWCDALIVCSILPLSFFLRIWHISNEMGLILVMLRIRPFPYNMLRIKFFHIVDPFKIWNDQLGHPNRYVKNYWHFFCLDFPKVWIL